MGTSGAKYYALNCKAKLFIDRAKKAYPDLVISDTPTPGSILVMGHDTKSGHVIYVEEVITPKKIKTSESSYNGKAFYSKIREYNNGHWGMSSAYYQIGFIQNPAVMQIPDPHKERDPHKDQVQATTDTLRIREEPSLDGKVVGHTVKDDYYDFSATILSDNYTWYQIGDKQWCAQTGSLVVLPKQRELVIGDKVLLDGPLYKSSSATTASGKAVNKNTVITRYVPGALHPYNTKGDLGWCDEDSMTLIDPDKQEYRINVVDTENCRIAVEMETALPGTAVQADAVPAPGYKVVSFTANNIPIEDYTFIMPASDVVVEAKVEKIVYNIFTEKCAHGFVFTDKVAATIGETVYINTEPEEHYKAMQITIDNASPHYNEEGKVVFEMPASDVTVSADFEMVVQPEYNVGDRVVINKPGNSEPNGAGFTTFNVNSTGIVSKIEWAGMYELADYCYQLRDLEGVVLGYYKEEDLFPDVENPDREYYIGQSVKILRKGNSRPDGSGYAVFGIGWEKQVLDFIQGVEFPYKIGRTGFIDVVQGYYKEEDLEEV